MDALAWHANGLRTAGQDFAETGAQVHSTWQGLAPVYEAPEAGQLFSVTTPVSQVSDRLGGDVEEVAGALSRYAEEARSIQQRLEQLRAQAQQLVTEINDYEAQGHTETQYVPSGTPHAPIAATQVPSTDWHDDEDLVERNNQLNSQVAAAVADWMAAQRRCANHITSLYGGTHYTADNADGHQTAGEFGYSKDQLAAAAAQGKLPWGGNEEATPDMGDMFADFGHGVLDVAGLVPVIGEPADGINASWYAAEGDYVNAGLSAAGMIPFVGWGATGSKLVGKGVKAAKGADEAAGAGKKSFDDLPEPVRRQIEAGNEFNRKQAPVYDPHNEITLNNGKRLDSYVPGDEIVSRKYTQLSDIQPGTASSYLSEFTSKYSPGETVADTSKARQQFPGEAGKEINGQMILEVPVQSKPVPDEVLKEATQRDILIRDTDGKIYNMPPRKK